MYRLVQRLVSCLNVNGRERVVSKRVSIGQRSYKREHIPSLGIQRLYVKKK